MIEQFMESVMKGRSMATVKKRDGSDQWNKREVKKRAASENAPNTENSGRKRSKRKPKARKSRSR